MSSLLLPTDATCAHRNTRLTSHPSLTTSLAGKFLVLVPVDCQLTSPILFPRYAKKPWSRFITSENQRYISNEAIDFLDKLLRFDHQERLTAIEAMDHPYFEGVREAARSAAASVVGTGV